jgi:glutamate/tyrosine decarboxylase-like PLP-dependent enzyme
VLEGGYDEVLDTAHRLAREWLEGLADRPVGPSETAPRIHAAIDGPVPEGPAAPSAVLDELVAAIDPGLAATGSGRYFGFVNGGTLPAALGADWLVTSWDQNTPFAGSHPGAAAFEEVAGRWVKELLGLPARAAVGFVTGAQMANTTCLAAARHEVLRAAGHDVETQGLIGAPPVRVVVGDERHSTIDRSLRFLGFGTASSRLVLHKAVRISVSNWRTDEDDVVRSVAAILRAHAGP